MYAFFSSEYTCNIKFVLFYSSSVDPKCLYLEERSHKGLCVKKRK